jgi:hypothetical protein
MDIRYFDIGIVMRDRVIPSWRFLYESGDAWPMIVVLTALCVYLKPSLAAPIICMYLI